MISVLICDDHVIVRQGIKQILADAGDITLAGEAGNGPDARNAASSGWPASRKSSPRDSHRTSMLAALCSGRASRWFVTSTYTFARTFGGSSSRIVSIAGSAVSSPASTNH